MGFKWLVVVVEGCDKWVVVIREGGGKEKGMRTFSVRGLEKKSWQLLCYKMAFLLLFGGGGNQCTSEFFDSICVGFGKDRSSETT